MNIETITAKSAQELGRLLKDKLNKGYFLYDFNKNNGLWTADLSIDETPLAELSDDEFNAKIKNDAIQDTLRKHNL